MLCSRAFRTHIDYLRMILPSHGYTLRGSQAGPVRPLRGAPLHRALAGRVRPRALAAGRAARRALASPRRGLRRRARHRPRRPVCCGGSVSHGSCCFGFRHAGIQRQKTNASLGKPDENYWLGASQSDRSVVSAIVGTLYTHVHCAILSTFNHLNFVSSTHARRLSGRPGAKLARTGLPPQ